jgi:hypothetical protein
MQMKAEIISIGLAVIASAMSLAVTDPYRRLSGPAAYANVTVMVLSFSAVAIACCFSTSILCCLDASLFFISFTALESAGTANFFGKRKFLAYPSETSTI